MDHCTGLVQVHVEGYFLSQCETSVRLVNILEPLNTSNMFHIHFYFFLAPNFFEMVSKSV